MARAGLDKNVVVEKAAQLANKMGIDQIQLKTLAESLSIQPPSLYNHIRGLDDLRRELMIYGWKQVLTGMLRGKRSAGHSISMRPKTPVCSAQCSGIINTRIKRRRASRKSCFPFALQSHHP